MRGCTVSAPVQSCNVHHLTATSNKFAAVELLTKESLYFVVEPGKSRAKDLYVQTCAYLNSQGMQDADLFGLAIVSDGEYLFVDPDNKLSKYAPKHWKSSNSYGLDSSNRPTLILYFRVQYYVDNSLLLRNNVTRHQYYLQLRANVVARGLVHACSSRDVLYILAGYALQADFGDYDSEQHAGAYFTPHEYLPREMVDSDVGLEQTIPALHRDNRGLGKAQAELRYIAQASSIEASRLTHNAHLYRLKHKKQEPGNGTVFLAICAKGIEIYEENSAKLVTATFLWNNIGKLCFDRKKFEIQALNWLTSGEKYTYFTNSDEKSKHLLFLCRVTHQFSMTIQTRLTEVKRLQEEERQRYRNCYMYSHTLGSGFIAASQFNLNSNTDQRTSVISNTSSNTTSGIVSDRVQSLDESEDDLELEIMINSPPAAARAEESVANETINVAEVKQPTPANVDGSQCSSSGSTVVVAAMIPGETTVVKRRASTTSSLELGFSHTAQNSTVSDMDYSVQSAHTSSGVYTARSLNTAVSQTTNTMSSETSGVATESSCDSLNYGTYSIATSALSRAGSSGFLAVEAAEDGNGERCPSPAASVVSATESFHGDGSDPSDCGPRNLLSAEELSDLIVGEIASGVYPGRATVSSTLDSDSDYVTLPPPPMPPIRSDSEANYVTLEPTSISRSSYASPRPEMGLAVPLIVEEANARFITTKPHINIITAHTSLIASTAPKSFAAPTHTYQQVNHAIYPVEQVKASLVSPQPSYLSYTSDPGAKMKPKQLTPLQVGMNNYLDVHASKNSSPYLRSWQYSPPVPPPTVLHPRQPPPPPPPQNLATVYTSQVTRGQIEQFRQQMHSDVDYVIYPLKDPAVSKQEYMDVKQGMLLARAVHYPPAVPPPPYPRITAENVIYRSTPNVAAMFPLDANYRAGYIAAGSHYSASTSPLYSAATSYSSSSTQSLRYSPMQAPPGFMRAKSDDNLLNSFDKYKRLPPPPPPPPYEVQMPEPAMSTKSDSAAAGMLDIRTLREKSKNLDLPLISALCNDRSLLKQTNAFVMPRHPASVGLASERPSSWHVETTSNQMEACDSNSTKHGAGANNKVKYPVSGLSTTQMCKPLRRVAASTHTHPNQSKSLLTLVGRSNSNGSAIKTRDAMMP